MLTRKMKDSGIEWIGEIPEDWEVRKLGNLSNLYTGNSIKDNEKDNYTDNLNSIPYIATKDVNNNHTINYKNGMYVKEDDLSFKIALKDSTLICIEGGSAGTKIAYLNQDVTFGNKLCAVYSEFVSNKYLYYYILSPCFNNSFNSRITGLIPGVTLSEMSKIEVVIPPATKQYKIVKALDEKVTKITYLQSETQQSIEELKKYKQSLITEAVTKGLDPNVEMKDSGIEWIGETPINWMVIKLNQLFSIKKNIANETGYDVLSVTQRGLRVRDITKNEGQMAADYSKYQIVEKDDFVMNHMDLLTGWVDIAKQQGVTSPDYRVFFNKQKERVVNDFFLYIFQTAYTNKIFYGLGQGVSNFGRWRLQTDKFLNFYVPLPNIEEQDQIVSYLGEQTSRIDKLIADKTKVIEELEDYKKSLIYEYVTGKKEA